MVTGDGSDIVQQQQQQQQQQNGITTVTTNVTQQYVQVSVVFYPKDKKHGMMVNQLKKKINMVCGQVS